MWLGLSIIFIKASPCRAAFERLAIGARPVGMGGAYVALADDADALFHNPAGIAQIPVRMIGASFSRPFWLEDLAVGSLACMQPGPPGRWGASWNTFGNNVYRENTFGLSASGFIHPRLCLGVTSKIHMLSIAGYGSASSLDMDIGCILKVTDLASGGLSLFNLFGSGLATDQERPLRLMTLGLRMRVSDDLLLGAQIEKETEGPILFRAGQEYEISSHGTIRLGLKTHPTELFGGVGFSLSRHRIDYACSSHPVLGLTHYVSLILRIDPPFRERN